MPGCTVPHCSNSSGKGFKLYHFPSDRERWALWVKNCGREEGWEPTLHTCICEVHFEESQFEMHRADGLRKLRPYAVPTLFNPTTQTITRRRKKNNNKPEERNIIQKQGVTKKSKQTEKDKNATPTSTNVSLNALKKPERSTGKRKRVNRRVSAEDASLIARKVRKPRINRMPLRKCVKTKGSTKEMGNRASSLTEDFSNNGPRASDIEDEVQEVSQSASEPNTCFICNSENKNIVPNNACTETSKINLKQKLVQLVSAEFDLLIKDIGAICINCAQILNCIDYIENVCYMLSKGIVNHMKQNFRMEPTEHVNLKLYMKSLKNLTDFYPWKEDDASHPSWKQKENELMTSELQHNPQSNKSPEAADRVIETEDKNHNIDKRESVPLENRLADKFSDTEDMNYNIDEPERDPLANISPDRLRETEDKNHNIDEPESVPLENRLENLTTIPNFECEMCSYATEYKALMIYHLRQHFKEHYTCDFCNIPVDYEPSPPETMQMSYATYKIRKKIECEKDKSNEIPPPPLSKSQSDYHQHNSDNLEKINVKMSRKRKEVNSSECHKNVKRSKISQKF